MASPTEFTKACDVPSVSYVSNRDPAFTRSPIVVNGDPSQIDLPNKNMSGLVRSKELLGHLNEIAVVDFDHSDVVRHPLVSKIVKAYSNDD